MKKVLRVKNSLASSQNVQIEPLSDDTKKRLMRNAREMVGKTWEEVVWEFDIEMAELRRIAELKPWEYWTDRIPHKKEL